MEGLVHQPVIILDHIKPTQRVAGSKAGQFLHGKPQGFDGSCSQGPAINTKRLAQSGNPKTRPAKGAQLIRRQADINDLDAAPDRDIAEDDIQQIGNRIIDDIGAVADFYIESARWQRARRDGFHLADNARIPNARRHAIARDFDRLLKADILGMRFNRPGIIRGDAIENMKPRRAHQNLKLPPTHAIGEPDRIWLAPPPL